MRRLLRWIQDHLTARQVDSPRVSAEILVAHVLECERLRLYMDIDRVATDAERARLRDLVARAARHEPVQYLVGSWPFFGRTFEVSPATLIPRPSTETLVEEAVRWYRETRLGEPMTFADVGTGTGIIAVSVVAEIRSLLRARLGRGGCRPIAEGLRPAKIQAGVPVMGREPTRSARDVSDRPGAGRVPRIDDAAGSGHSDPDESLPPIRCVASDISQEAADLARRNVTRHGLADAIDVRAGSLYGPLSSAPPVGRRSLDAILANPPYIRDTEWPEVAANVRDFEPHGALRAGRDGLDVIAPLVAGAPDWLRPGGILMLEIAASQRDAVERLLVASPELWTGVRTVKDSEGHWRLVIVHRR